MGQKIISMCCEKNVFTCVHIQVERRVSIHLRRVSNKVGDFLFKT